MDRRVITAIVLMMAIAMLPAVIFKRPPVTPGADSTAVAAAPVPGPAAGQAVDQVGEVPPAAPQTPVVAPPSPPVADEVLRPEEQIVTVHSDLYQYGVSSRGARLVSVRLPRYRSMAPADQGAPAELLHQRSDLLGVRLVVGADTLRLDDWDFTPSRGSFTVGGPDQLTLTAGQGGVAVELRYGFTPEEYQIRVEGRVVGLGPNGGNLLVGLGPGLRNTESDSTEHMRELAVVTKADETRKTAISKLDVGVPTLLSGPFEWAAIKSKYFVLGLFAVDSAALPMGRVAGVRALTTDGARKRPAEAEVLVSLPVTATGEFRYTLYAGPMEYPRLRAMGHDFYDVNPYGWPGFRSLIRPVAVAGRWLLVWMHTTLGLSYGLALVVFGIMVRVLLWPLNQKAMRSQMAMQAIQPLLKDVQERHKQDPQKLQQEMFKLYKEHKVNPFGGCWPMLLPFPVLLALFFVFLNTIELRGAPFMWLTDLSRPDPLYIIPVLMGVSMFGVSKIGQLGMPPNPQTKMMLYVMPVMMTVLFLNFASGLNLYYAVQNLTSIPQQWMIAKERQKLTPPPAPPPAAKGSAKKR